MAIFNIPFPDVANMLNDEKGARINSEYYDGIITWLGMGYMNGTIFSQAVNTVIIYPDFRWAQNGKFYYTDSAYTVARTGSTPSFLYAKEDGQGFEFLTTQPIWRGTQAAAYLDNKRCLGRHQHPFFNLFFSEASYLWNAYQANG